MVSPSSACLMGPAGWDVTVTQVTVASGPVIHRKRESVFWKDFDAHLMRECIPIIDGRRYKRLEVQVVRKS